MSASAPLLEHWMVVVGRNNLDQSSRALAQLLVDLNEGPHALGFAVYAFESGRAQRARRMNAWFAGLWGGRLATTCKAQARWGRWLQKTAKCLWRLAHPLDWSFDRLRGITQNERTAIELRQLLLGWQVQWPHRRVHLFAHSAGGIVSSWLQTEPNVHSLVCFGYPFRHPQSPEEAFRTAHLPGVTKPFLILQGDRDAYGPAAHARRHYPLSESMRLVPVDTDHNCDNLAPGVYAQCLQTLRDFYAQWR
ncbi:MAG: hypothetical protein RLZ63_292 [Pseudomonadota bacterium]|jgi:pimeloyl-ACP methyl ester carboxylesterase